MPYFKKPKHYTGIDCSSKKSRVLPPTFPGIKEFVKRYGEAQAALMFPSNEVDSPDSSKDVVRDFLSELQYADKVERETLVREFGDYVSDLENRILQDPEPTGAEDLEDAPKEEALDDGGGATPPTEE